MAYTTIDDPSAHFQTKIWTGTGSSNALTNDGNSDLQPDLLWIKNHDETENHLLFDSTRGVTLKLYVDVSNPENSSSSGNFLSAFGSDGFTVVSDTAANGTDDGMVAYQWKANGGTRTTNTENGNNPAGGYQANTTAGFSIVDYVGTGAAGTMAHGLGAVPHLMIARNREGYANWLVYHHKNTSAPETDYLLLDTNAATADDATYWNDTAPTSSVFTINDSDYVNKDADEHIAYLWTEIQGYSKFGSYIGNGNADGPFVYTGFKPAWFLMKPTIEENWRMYDNKRDPYNVMQRQLFPASTGADAPSSARNIDFLSNGFKIRASHAGINQDGITNVYMAFAEAPFVTSGGVPCTAR
jgi:hypothetical protein